MVCECRENVAMLAVQTDPSQPDLFIDCRHDTPRTQLEEIFGESENAPVICNDLYAPFKLSHKVQWIFRRVAWVWYESDSSGKPKPLAVDRDVEALLYGPVASPVKVCWG